MGELWKDQDEHMTPLLTKIKTEISIFASLGSFISLRPSTTYFHLLTRQGLGRGYFPELSKIVLIVHLDHLEARKLLGVCHGFKVCTAVHYIGGYIGYDESKREWLKECTLM